MLPLMEMLTKGNAAAMDTFARQFQLSREQTERAVEALMPAFSQGLKRNVADPAGFMSFMSALSGGGHARYFEDPMAAMSRGGMAEGEAILNHLFGSPEVSRAVAAHAATATGLSQAIMNQMLAALAPILMGGLFKQMMGAMPGATQSGAGANPLGRILEQMTGGAQGGSNPWGDLLGQMMGGAMRGQTPGSAPQAGANPWGKMFEDMMRGAQGGNSAGGRAQPVPGSDNPLGQIFQDMLRGGMGGMGGAARPTEEAPPEEETSYRSPEDGSPHPRTSGGLGDLFGEMFDAGLGAQREYQKGVEQIFEQFLGGKKTD